MNKYQVTNEIEYKIMKERLIDGQRFLDGKWFSSDSYIQKLVAEFEQMGIAVLDYEVEHNMLPI